MQWKYDCRYFLGYKPCLYKRVCEGCPHYDPMGTRLLLVKLGAMGDVLRTTGALPALRERYGALHVTWVAAPASVPLLAFNPYVDRVLPVGPEASARVAVESFDVAACLDKEPAATSLVMQANAKAKLGFGMHPAGGVFALTAESDEALRLGLDDDLKFRRNRKSYQEVTFDQLGLRYSAENADYVFRLTPEEHDLAERFRASHALTGAPVVGLNTGAGSVFANKAWTLEGYAELAGRLHRDRKAKVVLLGGPAERERNAEIARRAGVPTVDAGTDNPVRVFAAKLSVCDAVVTGDSMAMHLSLALRRRTVVLFGSTSPHEVELFGRGVKVVTPIACHPCYLASCDIHPSCQERITVDAVARAVEQALALPSDAAPAAAVA